MKTDQASAPVSTLTDPAAASDTPTAQKIKDFSDPISLEKPVARGNTEIDSITLRRPGSGELRGVSLLDLAHVSVSALLVVLPRITIPSLTVQEVRLLDPADLMQIGIEVASFLATRDELGTAFPTA
jgi:hypothetical protein